MMYLVLVSYLNLQSNKSLRNKIAESLSDTNPSQVKLLMDNISECVNNTVHYNKYQWIMPIVPLYSYQEARSNGLAVGREVWKRSVKLYKETNDVTARTTRNSKVCVLGHSCTSFMPWLEG